MQERLCKVCGQPYDNDPKWHEIIEPKSGTPRERWLTSGLSFDDWLGSPEGVAWVKCKGFMK